MSLKKKILIGIGVIVLIIAAAAIYFYNQSPRAKNITFGLTFSAEYAQSLGFDPKYAYLDMLNDLQPKKLRLMAYWETIEPKQGKYDFTNMDWMLDEAAKRNIDVILAVGHKIPRWPECHQPDWYGKLDSSAQQSALNNMLTKTVEHFKTFSAIKNWQVENEPYFGFGIDCPTQSVEMISKEVQLVKSLDHTRPIVLTGSGEQGSWNLLAKSGADIVGVTMYRTVYSDRWGYYKYPIGPWFYRIKAGIEKTFYGKPVIGAELQAEPWLLSGIFNTPVADQSALMNPKVFAENVQYAKDTGFADNYIWGVEWWYWLAKKQGDFGMWSAAKGLLNPR